MSATRTIAELAVLALGIVLVTAVNVLLLRRVFGPLEQLASLMRRVEPGEPGRRITTEPPVAELPTSPARSTTGSTGSSA